MRQSLMICGLCVLLTDPSSALKAQTPSSVELTAGGKDLQVNLAPGQSREFSVRLAGGTAALLTVAQTAGSVEVAWTRQAGTPRTNPAGLESKITFLMIADAAETEEIGLQALSKTKGAIVTLHVDAAHAFTDADRREVTAETAFARAENIRLQRKASDYASALADYDKAASIWLAAGDEAQTARALTWKALFLFVNKADATGALPVIQEARTHEAALAPVEKANCLKVAGYVNVQLAHYDDGRSAYQQAIKVFATTGDLYNQEVLLDNLSRVDRLLGDNDRALADAKQAESLAARIGDVTRQLKIKAELGAIQISASNLEAAYAEYRSSLALLKDHPDPTTEAYVWSDLGVLYTQLHQPKQAADALERAMQLWKQNPNPVGEINTLDDFGELWMTESKLPLARSYYERGLTVAKEKELPRDQVYLLRGLGATYLLENNLVKAQTNLDQALALALKIKEGDGLPEIYCLTGDLHVRQHEEAAAEEAYVQCRKTAADAKDTASLIRADGSVARLRFAEGKVDEASERIEQALTAIEGARSAIPEQDLRTSFFFGFDAVVLRARRRYLRASRPTASGRGIPVAGFSGCGARAVAYVARPGSFGVCR
jgi:tetratricopeptide (TPR) repeat protein